MRTLMLILNHVMDFQIVILAQNLLESSFKAYICYTWLMLMSQ